MAFENSWGDIDKLKSRMLYDRTAKVAPITSVADMFSDGFWFEARNKKEYNFTMHSTFLSKEGIGRRKFNDVDNFVSSLSNFSRTFFPSVNRKFGKERW